MFLRTLFTAVLLFAVTAQGYIPPTKLILSRTTATQGKNGYIVVLETRLNGDADNLAFRETWTIRDAHSMRLSVEGLTPVTKNFRREYVYRDNHRYRLSAEGEVMAADLASQHFERYFHFRDGERFHGFLKAYEVIPKYTKAEADSTGTPESGVKNSSGTTGAEKKAFPYEPNPYVRLSRWDGKVTYAFGVPTPAKNDLLLAGLWIEQDDFHILRVRTPFQTEMTAKNYQTAWGLSYPKTREIKWKGNTVTVTMVSLEKAVIGPKTKQSLEPASLKSTQAAAKSEMIDTLNTSIMNEFYQRFR